MGISGIGTFFKDIFNGITQTLLGKGQTPSVSSSLDELKQASQADILAAIVGELSAFSKDQLISFLLHYEQVQLDSPLEVPDPVIYSGDARGPLAIVQVVRDIDGNKIRTKSVSNTYYPTGEVDEITIVDLDGSDKEVSRKVIKHFTDGKQPEVIG